MIDFCRQTGLRVANGRVGEDKTCGRRTYMGNRGSSLINYVIVSEELLKAFSSFCVCDPNILSDHCVLNFALDINNGLDTAISEQNAEAMPVKSKYVWNSNMCENYDSSGNVTEELDNIFSSVDSGSSDAEVENSINSFFGYFRFCMYTFI